MVLLPDVIRVLAMCILKCIGRMGFLHFRGGSLCCADNAFEHLPGLGL